MTDAHGKRYDYGYMDVGLTRPVEKEGNPIQDDILNFNLNGQRVADPSNGIFIRKQGSKTSKTVIR